MIFNHLRSSITSYGKKVIDLIIILIMACSTAGALPVSAQPAIQVDDATDTTCYTLTILVDPAESGTVSTVESPPNCNEGTQYTEGSVVAITAIPGAGYRFDLWAGDVSGNEVMQYITMNSDHSVMALFSPNEVNLTIQYVGDGTVERSPDGIYHTGDDVQLTAAPYIGWHFVEWSGDLSSTENPVTLNLDGDKVITAIFEKNTVSLTIDVIGSGTVEKAPADPYLYSDLVQLIAVPDEGWHFDHWEGDLQGEQNPVNIGLSGSKSITAVFVEGEEVQVTIQYFGDGTVERSSPGPYYEGDDVQLTATSYIGWHFVEWSGDLSSTENPVTLNLDSDKVITAIFEKNTVSLTIDVIGSGTVEKAPGDPYLYNDLVYLTAFPDDGWHFDHWEGDLQGWQNPVKVGLSDSKSITAVFVEDAYTIEILPNDCGYVTIEPAGPYKYGDIVQLTAVSYEGYHFGYWDINDPSSFSGQNPLDLFINGDMTVDVTFFVNGEYQMAVFTRGQGSVEVDPRKSLYQYGDIVKLTAFPEPGWGFKEWGISHYPTSTENPLYLMIDDNITVEATFTNLYDASTWYLAEGYTGAGFDTFILLQNPGGTEANVRLTYMLEGGGTEIRYLTIPANSRFTVTVKDAAQLGADAAFSTRIDASQQIIVERAMYWPNGDGTIGGHVTTGVQGPQSNWYLAEGYTGAGFETFILVQNPSNLPTEVLITYMLQGGGNLHRRISVPANSRYTIAVHDPAQLGLHQEFSTRLISIQPIIVEQAMYFSNEGHVTTGVGVPTYTWYLAEGYTGQGYQTYILVQNPNVVEVTVEVTYMLQDGSTQTRTIDIAANARCTINVSNHAQLGLDAAFSTKLVGSQPIIVERAMYWTNGPESIAGHASNGISTADTDWYLAEGYTGAGFDTFILIQNPGASSADVTVTYMFDDGSTSTQSITVDPNSRYTIVTKDIAEVGPDKAFSTRLTSSQPIIVERAMYFNNGGHASSGMTISDR